MSPSEELIAHLKHFEGFVGHVYLCGAGKPTIGYGHRVDLDARYSKDSVITEEEAHLLLLEDIAKYTLMAARMSPILKSAAPRRLAAIIDFCFNAGGSAYAGSTLRKKVDAGLWAEAAAENDRWVYVTDPKTGKKKKLAWQVKRRAATSNWLRNG